MTYVAIPSLRVYLETDAAICVAVPGMDSRSQRFAKECSWIPKVFLDHDDNELNELNDEGDLVIPKWVADQNEFTNYEELD